MIRSVPPATGGATTIRLCVALSTPVVGKRNSTSPCTAFALGISPSEALTFRALHPPTAQAQPAKSTQSSPCCSFPFTAASTPSVSDPLTPTALPRGCLSQSVLRCRCAAPLPPLLPRTSSLAAHTRPSGLPSGRSPLPVSRFPAPRDRRQSARSLPSPESAAHRFPAT